MINSFPLITMATVQLILRFSGQTTTQTNLIFSIRKRAISLIQVYLGEIPAMSLIVSDYDGDEIDDIAIYRPTTNTWFVSQSLDSTVLTHTFGQENDKPIIGDFDGDGKLTLTF